MMYQLVSAGSPRAGLSNRRSTSGSGGGKYSGHGKRSSGGQRKGKRSSSGSGGGNDKLKHKGKGVRKTRSDKGSSVV